MAGALGPLDGFRVLDAGTRIAASFCAGALGELGADVIKVEQPGAGEFLRYLGPLHHGNSLMWSVEGRGRKSITLDLRLREGQVLLRRLAERVDVLCENFRPGTMERWRLGPNDLPPSLVYVRVSVFGQTGPLARRPGVDMVGIAHGGLLGLTGYPDGPPMKSNITISDHLTGVFAAKAAVFALFRREVDGDGAVVDASLFGSIFRTLDWRIAAEEKGAPATRSGALDPDLPGLLLIEGADGRYVATGASLPTDLDALTAVIWPGNRPDDGSASRVDSASRVITSALTADELIRELEKAEVPHALVRTPRDIVDEHRLGHMSSELVEVTDPVLGNCLQPAAFPVVLDTDQQPTGAPAVGEHNTEIWCGLVGLSSGELANLMERGVILLSRLIPLQVPQWLRYHVCVILHRQMEALGGLEVSFHQVRCRSLVPFADGCRDALVGGYDLPLDGFTGKVALRGRRFGPRLFLRAPQLDETSDGQRDGGVLAALDDHHVEFAGSFVEAHGITDGAALILERLVQAGHRGLKPVRPLGAHLGANRFKPQQGCRDLALLDPLGLQDHRHHVGDTALIGQVYGCATHVSAVDGNESFDL